jgi:ABC-2 type transport system permease protein
MSKTTLIIKREYLTRVRKKSFIIMSILGPILFAAFMIVPAVLATLEDKEVKTIAVIDQSTILTSYATGEPKTIIPNTEYIKFVTVQDTDLETLKEHMEETGYYAVLFIPENVFTSERAVLYSYKQPSLEVSMHIENAIEKEIEDLKLVANNIENLDEILKEIETSISVTKIKWTKDGEEKKTSTWVVMAVGYLTGFMIYFFIFLFGAQVMRGVLEEKTNRIVEVIVSSVKPFQLMMGKIIGIGLVGLTQFLIWVVFTGILVLGAQQLFLPELSGSNPVQQAAPAELFSQGSQQVEAAASGPEANEMIVEVMESIGSINIGVIFFSFIFYFLFGYLLYGSMFAVVGAASDNETDTQQFMLPITLPLILAILVMMNTINNPEGPLAFWFSMIPFTSPVVMMVRIPFGVPAWELMLSGGLLVLTYIGMTWVAGKIYRTGILMYGKKVTYKELWKWLRYKN